VTDRTLAIFGVVGTTIFGLLSIFLYRRSRHLRRLDALWSVATLQSKKHQDVRILFKDREIDDLSRLRILLVNSGTLAIRPGSDFPVRSGGAVNLHKRGDVTQFLSAAAIVGDVASCSATALVNDQGIVAVAFEYLNPRQRVGIEVLYTGPPPQVDVELIGGSVRLRQSSGRHWIDVVAGEIFPGVAAIAAYASAVGVFRLVSRAGLPLGHAVAAAASLVFSVVVVLIYVRFIVPAWRRSRDARRGRLSLDFLAGRERPNQALHPPAASQE
jgi:hypothetical protein